MRLEKPSANPYYTHHKAQYLCWINQFLKEIDMRLYAPLDESNSILRPGAALGEPAAATRKTPATRASIVRSNIGLEAANESTLDIAVIEQDARNQRNIKFGHIVKSLFTTIGAWLERNENRERDHFFAASDNLADLEQRQRHFERTGVAHY